MRRKKSRQEKKSRTPIVQVHPSTKLSEEKESVDIPTLPSPHPTSFILKVPDVYTSTPFLHFNSVFIPSLNTGLSLPDFFLSLGYLFPARIARSFGFVTLALIGSFPV
jgi:hypothetical protein